MAFNYNKLKGRIIEKYGSQSAFTKELGYSNNTFSLKMNNKVRFTSDDIVKISKLLDISPDEVGAYFFTLSV